MQSIASMHTRSSGVFYIIMLYTVMRVLCYESFATGQVRELLWLNSLWVSALAVDACRFYIREDRVSFAFILDPNLRRIYKEDYIL